MIPIIDMHQHLWDPARLKPPWAPDTGPLAANHTLADYARESDGLGIAHTVYMEVAVRREDLERESDLAIAWCRDPASRMVGAFVGARPAEPGFAAYIARFAGAPCVRGVRQIVRGDENPPGTYVRSEFVQGVRALGGAGLAFAICTSADRLPEAARLCDLCPDTRFVLDHCGNPDVRAPERAAWERDIAAIARRRNVVCKISGIVGSAAPEWRPEDLAPFVRRCADAFGRERILFASDWPVCTLRASLRQWVEAARAIAADWPEAERVRLFHDNAARWLGLPPAAGPRTR